MVGSFTAILLIPTITHTEFALTFEITPGKSLFFYFGVFASIFAVITKLIPDDTEVVNAEETLKRVVEYTHYMPGEWKENLHADDVCWHSFVVAIAQQFCFTGNCIYNVML